MTQPPDDQGEPGACFIPRPINAITCSASWRACPSEDLRRPILPSQWTCAGLVHHLAIDVERFWFRAVVAGEQLPEDEPDNAWQVPADLTATAVLDAYRREIRACRRHHCRHVP